MYVFKDSQGWYYVGHGIGGAYSWVKDLKNAAHYKSEAAANIVRQYHNWPLVRVVPKRKKKP